MSISKTALVLLSLIGFGIILTGCTKDSAVPDTDVGKDLWEVMPTSDLNVYSADDPYEIHFGPDGQLFVLQPSVGSSFTYCSCENESGEWVRFTVDSTISVTDNELITRVLSDGSLCILTATRLVKVTSCGVFESYPVVNSDTLSANNSMDRFIGLEVVNGTPWLLHGVWGLFRFDIGSQNLEHKPILSPYPFYADLSEIEDFQSLAKLPDGIVIFNNEDGRSWIRSELNGVAPVELIACSNCKYYNLRTSPTGLVIAMVDNGIESERMRSLPNLTTIQTLPLSAPPEFFTTSVFDHSGYLAYYSGFPYNQPYIGLQPNGSGETILNAQDAIEQGNLVVYDLAFNNQNELFVATSHGVLKYLGRDE